jgi:hypothetical protein
MELVKISNEVDLMTDLRICISLLNDNTNLLVAFFQGRSKSRRQELLDHKAISVKIPKDVKDFLVKSL